MPVELSNEELERMVDSCAVSLEHSRPHYRTKEVREAETLLMLAREALAHREAGWQTGAREALHLMHAAGLTSAELIHGGARGADWCAHLYAEGRREEKVFPADWKQHGSSAGPRRNQQMLDEGKPDLVVAFPGGRGTADMVRRARKAGVEVREVHP